MIAATLSLGVSEPVRWADEGSFGVDVVSNLLDASRKVGLVLC